MNKEEKQKLINEVPFWLHSIDCDDVVMTKGVQFTASRIAQLNNLLQVS
jgi:hypothetical protein